MTRHLDEHRLSGLTPPPSVAAAQPHVPGPVDRVHFLDEQRRYRRASRRFTLLAMLAVLITGIPACVVVTPLVFTVVLTIGHIVNAIVSLSPDTLKQLQEMVGAISTAADAIDSGTRPGDWVRVAFGIGVLVLPGALALLLLWLAIRKLLGRVAVGHSLERTGARPPNERDLEERQLGNVVEEMAVAAGVKPPRLLILDTDAVNAAAFGEGIDNATVIVTRGLLDKLDRDETQAVIGHVIGSVGNGDLKIASIIFSIYETWGALTLLMQAPFAKKSRGVIWRAFRTGLRGRSRTVDQWEAESVSEAFLRGSVEFEDEDIDRRMSSKRKGLAGKWDAFVNMLSLPVVLGSYVVKFAVFISSMALIGPIIAFMWRTRRHLADAMAVQLTRNPDALARAIHHLGREKTHVSAGDQVSLLFVVWPSTVASKDAVVGQFSNMQPKLEKRARRLVALGADPSIPQPTSTGLAAVFKGLRGWRTMKWTPVSVVFMFLFFVVVPVLSATALVLGVIVLGMLTMLSLMLMMVQMFVIFAVLKLVFITIPGWIGQ